MIELYNELQKLTPEIALEKVLGVVEEYSLSKTNAEGFNQLRKDYNNNNDWLLLYAMVTHAFNYQIRFNQKGEYNMPFGKDRSWFNPSLQKKLVTFVKEINLNNYIFTNKDFRKLVVDKLKENDLVYCDPPYLASTVVYSKENAWSEKDEKDLLRLLDELNDNNIKFMLSNVFENKGKENLILKEWSKKYNVVFLDHTYQNCNYQSKNKDKNTTIEVLIRNY